MHEKTKRHPAATRAAMTRNADGVSVCHHHSTDCLCGWMLWTVPPKPHSSPEGQKYVRLYEHDTGYPVVGALFSGGEFIRLLTQPEVDECRGVLGKLAGEAGANEVL